MLGCVQNGLLCCIGASRWRYQSSADLIQASKHTYVTETWPHINTAVHTVGAGPGGGVNVPERRLLYSSRLYSFAKVPKKTEKL